MISQNLLPRSLIILAVGSLLVVLCYFLVDRQVAFFIHDHKLDKFAVFKWITYFPVWCENAAPIMVVMVCIALAWHSWSRFELFLFTASVNLLVTLSLCENLKVVFGRAWPGTWINNNPSLLENGVYGFHFLRGSEEFGSFPSGHTARIVAIMAVVWFAYPRWRWLAVLGAALVVISLVMMDYHFVGDTVAGATISTITSMYAVHLSGLVYKKEQP